MLLVVASEHCRRTDVANHVPEHKLPMQTVWARSNTLFETKDTPQRLIRLEVGIKDAQLHGNRDEVVVISP
jgi:acyl carrier protein phosphodiesterase